ncbi:DUF4168 domain-containing protein [Joostella atrarenae]|uniref:DUF4168 domain-containing protein n=1 Tax=Joostella atrarenae TaxID=679257 RepID=A0ABS9IZS3_9FLAO|nr:DUF4168 domain-containing protein [Joostella atrarenae]MCF8713672.1 DUF4168 domain-containing protein [Joostella atrarenae]
MLVLKRLKIVFLFVALLGSVSAFAQVPAPAPAPAENISDAELQQFAEAYMGIQMKNQEAQQAMTTTIKDHGIALDRFNEIQQASMDPNKEVDASEDELAKHKAAIADLEKLQPKFQSQMETVITDTGLSIERYQAVASSVQASKELQQKLQGIMVKMQQG